MPVEQVIHHLTVREGLVTHIAIIGGCRQEGLANERAELGCFPANERPRIRPQLMQRLQVVRMRFPGQLLAAQLAWRFLKHFSFSIIVH